MTSPDKTRYPNNPLRSPVQKQLAQIFGDLEVVDAAKPLRMFPFCEDFDEGKGATRLDPHNCGFSRCGARAVGATAALVFHKTAYFDHLSEDGKRRIHRYRNSRPVSKVVEAFDVGKEININIPFDFLPPTKTGQLTKQRQKGKRLFRNPRSNILYQEWMARDRLNRATADLTKLENRLSQQKEKYAPTAKTVVETVAQISNLKTRLKELREDFDAKHKEAKEVRMRPYRPIRIEGRTHNLNVRNNTGFMSKLRPKKRKAA